MWTLYERAMKALRWALVSLPPAPEAPKRDAGVISDFEAGTETRFGIG